MADYQDLVPGPTWLKNYRHPQVPLLQPQVYLVNDIESITPSGTVPTAGNSGSATSNAFDSNLITNSGSVISDTSYSAHGLYSLQFSVGSVSSNAQVFWTQSIGATQNQLFFRMYLRFVNNPNSNLRILRMQTAAQVLCGSVAVNATGKVLFLDSLGATILTSTASVPLNQFFRVEGFIYGHSTAGQLEFKLFNSMDSTSILETKSSLATQNTLGPIGQAVWGPGGATNIAPFNLDDPGVSSIGYMGPASGVVPGNPAAYTIQSVVGQTWKKQFQHPQDPIPAPPLFINPDGGAAANISVDAPASPYAGATGPNIVSQAAPGTTWNRAFLHKQDPAPNPPIFVAGITANIAVDAGDGSESLLVTTSGTTANISVDSASQNVNVVVAGVTANISVDVPISPYAGATGPNIVTIANPGQTWKRAFQHPNEPIPGPPVFILGVTANISVDVSGQSVVSPQGTVANISVVATQSPYAGATGPNIVSQAYPGTTWQRFFQHKQAIAPNPPPPPINLAGVTANISVDSPTGSVQESVSATANISVDVPSSPYAGATGPVIVSQAAPGQAWTRYFQHKQSPLLPPPVFIAGVTANISVDSPAGSMIATVSGTIANISVDAPAGSAAQVVIPPSTQIQPGQSWTRFFWHRQQPQPNPPIFIQGITANITVGSSGTVQVSPNGVTANISVDVPAGTVVNAVISITANITVGSSGNILVNPTGVTANIAVSSSGTIVVNQLGPPANIIVSASAGLAGQMVITGSMDSAWSGSMQVSEIDTSDFFTDIFNDFFGFRVVVPTPIGTSRIITTGWTGKILTP